MNVLSIFETYHNVMTTKEAVFEGIPKAALKKLLINEIIEKTSYGIYVVKNKYIDEFYLFQKQYPSVIFSHNTALYFHNMSERTPAYFDVTVYNGYNSYRFKERAKIFSVKREIHNLGAIKILSPQGLPVKAYNLERCVCDLIKPNNSLDIELRNKAIRGCINSKGFDGFLMYDYANKMRVYELVRNYMEAII